MKIEMPQEPEVERLWVRSRETGIVRYWVRVESGWQTEGAIVSHSWAYLLSLGTVYTTHPDLAALDKYPAPFSVSPAGTIRDATGKAVLDPNQQCPPCLTRFFMRAANFYAEHYAGAMEDEKR